MLGSEIVEKSKIAFRGEPQGDGTPIVVRVRVESGKAGHLAKGGR